MNVNLAGKTAFVGGGSKGIGLAIGKELASLGANVILAARSEDLLVEAVRDLAQSGDQSHRYLVVDYANSTRLKEQAELLSQTGTVHILINNTGGPKGGPILEADPSEFVQAFHNHVVCNQVLAQAFVPGMQNEGYGRIVNIISTSVKQPLFGLGVSNTIRGAVANWAKTLANELGGAGITVNNLLPGATATHRLDSIIANRAQRLQVSEAQITENMLRDIPAGRFAQPDEIAAAVTFLCSPSAAYINGINFPVDGGRTKSL